MPDGLKESSPALSSLASQVLRRTRDGLEDPELDLTWLLNSARRLAGSVLGQDETTGHQGAGKRQARPSALVPTVNETQVIVGDGLVRAVVADRGPEWWDGYWTGLWQRQRGR